MDRSNSSSPPRGRALRRLAAGAAVGVLVLSAAACGDDDKSDKGKSAPSSAGSSGGADVPAAKIIGLWQVKGEDPNAIDDYQNGALVAVDEINAKGGVLGKPLQFERVPSGLNPTSARSAFLAAKDKDPSGMVGFPGGTEAEGLQRDIDAARIPIVNVNNDITLLYGAKNGSEWMFTTNPYDGATAKNMVALAQKNGWTKLGVLGNDLGYGRDGTDRTKRAAEGTPVTVGATRLVPVAQTDLTEAVLALKDSTAVVSWSYPNTLAAQLKQMAQNNITTPVVGGGSTPVVVNYGLAKGKEVENLHAVLACLPSTDQRPSTKAFNDAYKAKYKTDAPPLAAAAHDAVWLQAEAMKKAGTTTDHAKIKAALEQLSWTEGACQPEYKADPSHVLAHQQIALKYDANGVATVEDTYKIPELAKGSS
ncbi:ABC transporter substrate-binding protein [Yinghuangia seranimata]|uniref:ABC transporter substrate-binding protein n=1 Tax=Yinghuangia seranimata TaxID=408067 RepID=UPI00248B764E|nr:ABC transporter substrate-binding protein [Yinghuangia seranimata]MDI2127314.1 ABC transporter substrate-binding protein [Yinghuangia seranimata]